MTNRIGHLSELREKQESRIAKRESANQRLREMSNRQELSIPEVNRSLVEAEKLMSKLIVVRIRTL